MTVARRFLNCTSGAAAAEMALILPLAVLMLFTTLEAGHWMYAQHQVVKGLRDGARYAARQSFDDVNCRGGSPTISNSVIDATREITRTGQLSGGNPRVAGWDAADITVTATCPVSAEAQTGIFDAGEPAPQVNVSTTTAYNSLFNGLGVITDSVNLVGEQQAVVMGI
ncbi:MAG: hypothetical protein APF82_08900 [Sphingomonadales bacterium BRH_c42]|nr:MAG: hypothetical protein APF82_08900 [Sphingomonadales bacterium BRH_c42]